MASCASDANNVEELVGVGRLLRAPSHHSRVQEMFKVDMGLTDFMRRLSDVFAPKASRHPCTFIPIDCSGSYIRVTPYFCGQHLGFSGLRPHKR